MMNGLHPVEGAGAEYSHEPDISPYTVGNTCSGNGANAIEFQSEREAAAPLMPTQSLSVAPEIESHAITSPLSYLPAPRSVYGLAPLSSAPAIPLIYPTSPSLLASASPPSSITQAQSYFHPYASQQQDSQTHQVRRRLSEATSTAARSSSEAGDSDSGSAGGPLTQRQVINQPITFAHKLYDIVMDDENYSYIRWGSLGTTFVVPNADNFARSILPHFFKHSNFSSFVRQLNMYGFHKINKTPRRPKGSADTSSWEFQHRHFIRGRRDLVDEIKRRVAENVSDRSSQSESSNNYMNSNSRRKVNGKNADFLKHPQYPQAITSRAPLYKIDSSLLYDPAQRPLFVRPIESFEVKPMGSHTDHSNDVAAANGASSASPLLILPQSIHLPLDHLSTSQNKTTQPLHPPPIWNHSAISMKPTTTQIGETPTFREFHNAEDPTDDILGSILDGNSLAELERAAAAENTNTFDIHNNNIDGRSVEELRKELMQLRAAHNRTQQYLNIITSWLRLNFPQMPAELELILESLRASQEKHKTESPNMLSNRMVNIPNVFVTPAEQSVNTEEHHQPRQEIYKDRESMLAYMAMNGISANNAAALSAETNQNHLSTAPNSPRLSHSAGGGSTTGSSIYNGIDQLGFH